MSITCTRSIEFDSAHRVMGHEGKCKYLHGHRYRVEATFTVPRPAPPLIASENGLREDELDSLGRVIDFGEIRTRLGEWIQTNWDHNLILFNKDAALGAAVQAVTGQNIFYLPANPTAENMARYLLEEVCPNLFAGAGAVCVSIRLYETPHCVAEAKSS